MISVVIADQHSAVRAGIKAVLGRAFRVAGEADNGREAVRLALRHKPDVVIMDIPMPRMNGVLAAQEITDKLPQTRVLVLSASDEDYRIDGALSAGVSGFLVKDSDIESLPGAVRRLHEGQRVFSPQVEEYLARTKKQYPVKSPSGLTRREEEVIQLVAHGFTNKEIASELSIKPRTVDAYVQGLNSKLNCKNRVQLARYAIKTGISQ